MILLHFRRLAFVSLLALAGCSSVEMSLEELPDSDLSVTLAEDARVYVAQPSLTSSAAARLDEERIPRGRFSRDLQRSMERALERRGATAVESSEEADSVLLIRVTDFGRTGGTAGLFFRGGVDYSTIHGDVLFGTAERRRELRIENAGAEAEPDEADERTAANIHAFTAAVAESLQG